MKGTATTPEQPKRDRVGPHPQSAYYRNYIQTQTHDTLVRVVHLPSSGSKPICMTTHRALSFSMPLSLEHLFEHLILRDPLRAREARDVAGSTSIQRGEGLHLARRQVDDRPFGRAEVVREAERGTGRTAIGQRPRCTCHFSTT